MVLKMREPTYTRTSLDNGWEFKEYNEEGSGDFTAVSQFPTSIRLSSVLRTSSDKHRSRPSRAASPRRHPRLYSRSKQVR
jgi:hypothetical protein